MAYVLVFSLQTVQTSTSNTSTSAAAAAAAGGAGGDVAYHVTASEFISCRLDGSLVSSAVPTVTAYDRLQAASNYFIGERGASFLTAVLHTVLHSQLAVRRCQLLTVTYASFHSSRELVKS